MLSAMMAGRRAASGTAGRWRGQPPPSSLLLRTLPLPVPPSEAVVVARQQQQQQQQQPQRNNNQRSLKQKQRPGRFRKEAQDKVRACAPSVVLVGKMREGEEVSRTRRVIFVRPTVS